MSPNSNADLLFYGRRKGKKLHVGRLDALESVLPEIRIALPTEGLVDPHHFFSFPVSDIHFEIGFGNGENLLHQAMNNPEIGFIGCEPFVNGVATLCKHIRDNKVKNIRIWPDDARLLMMKLNPQSMGRIFVLNADPWPKTRHWKRRFIQTETLNEINRLLKPDGELRMSTDHAALAAWLIEKTYFHSGFTWLARSQSDWRERPVDMQETRYQKRGLQHGRQTVFLNFKRNGG